MEGRERIPKSPARSRSYSPSRSRSPRRTYSPRGGYDGYYREQYPRGPPRRYGYEREGYERDFGGYSNYDRGFSGGYSGYRGPPRPKREVIKFAFTAFEDRAEAQIVKDKFDGYSIDGRRLRIDWDIGREKKESIRPRYDHPPPVEDRKDDYREARPPFKEEKDFRESRFYNEESRSRYSNIPPREYYPKERNRDLIQGYGGNEPPHHY
ncbi:hypothetical protein HDV06_004559 [Boothiomyces sp. JEL0866]|nr:hypothetical protein HDV06_004559 [Boothiomyces sp. JEL0866]